MESRNRREGSYCGKTSQYATGQRHHIRSKHCDGHPPGTHSANLELRCRDIRRAPGDLPPLPAAGP